MRKLDRTRFASANRHALVLMVAAACGLATFIGGYVSLVPPIHGLAWPPAAIALVGLLAFGYHMAPGAFAGTLVGMLFNNASPSQAVIVALVITAQAAVGARLAARYAPGVAHALRSRAFAKFIGIAGILAAAVGPVVGIPALTLFGSAPDGPAAAAALRWWIGSFVEIVVVAPLLLSWLADDASATPARRGYESLALAGALGVSWAALSGGRLTTGVGTYPLAVLCVPPLLWAAYRFGPRTATLAIVGLAAIASGGALVSSGSFADTSAATELVATQAFVGVIALTTVALAIVTAERRTAEQRLLTLAQTDGLTGLANYRALMDALATEVSRSMRRASPFAVVLIDVDRLKEINDTLGHMIGNVAISRVADALRATCRAIDTAARIGGDEFCVLLPGAIARDAVRVVERIRATLAAARLGPRVAVSAGIALYPRDGATGEQLLSAADAALYDAKPLRARKQHVG